MLLRKSEVSDCVIKGEEHKKGRFKGTVEGLGVGGGLTELLADCLSIIRNGSHILSDIILSKRNLAKTVGRAKSFEE